jgi:transposase InsO family protein
MCKLTKVSRAGLYRYRKAPVKTEDPDLELRDAIQKIALKMPAYGRRRITAELREAGWDVGPKRVSRIMREDNLLCLRRGKFVKTTDSSHAHAIYPNVAASMQPTGTNQLWVADITYIRLETEFVYLAVVLDAFSRRVVGWELDRTLEAKLAIGALNRALAERQPAPGLVHHSDRGVQYACGEYTGILKERGITISMSAKGNPYDNAFCESFMKTLKYEEVYRQEYRSMAEALASIARFIDQVYNRERLHSALGYRPPEQFERESCQRTQVA